MLVVKPGVTFYATGPRFIGSVKRVVVLNLEIFMTSRGNDLLRNNQASFQWPWIVPNPDSNVFISVIYALN